MERYKRGMVNGTYTTAQRKVFIEALGVDSLSKEFAVHHLDGDRYNNDIDNLALLTVTAHNRIHSHEAWNKGLTTETSTKFKRAIKRRDITKRTKYLERCEETYLLRIEGKKYQEIADMLGITRNTASTRCKEFIKFKKK